MRYAVQSITVNAKVTDCIIFLQTDYIFGEKLISKNYISSIEVVID